MKLLVLPFSQIDRSQLAIVGGKAANLGELCKIPQIQVPDGICITTEAFSKHVSSSSSFKKLTDDLSQLQLKNREQLASLSAEIRALIEDISIQDNLKTDIQKHLLQLGNKNWYAIRSSATAEDLPDASFAGQQDTFLNIVGEEAILKHISKCWASLFTERAVIYRIQNKIDHRKVQMAVIIQKMIFSEVSGIMFTADPVTNHRKVVSIDASFGLGEALVSGIVSADNYKVKENIIIAKNIASKELQIQASEKHGVIESEIDTPRQKAQALADAQILELEKLGRVIEKHFASPQDIEWCLVENRFYFVQSRPITTLFPVPEKSDDDNRVYLSVGHQQMMTDAMKPLGLSVRNLTLIRPMPVAGGRMFADFTPQLASPVQRNAMLTMFGKFDVLIKDAMVTLLERGDFIKTIEEAPVVSTPAKNISAQDAVPAKDSANKKFTAASAFDTLVAFEPGLVDRLIKESEDKICELKKTINTKEGPELFDFIRADLKELNQHFSSPKSMEVVLSGMNAAIWINDRMQEWLGEKNVADTLSQSQPNNITSEMVLEMMDLADTIRPYPQIVQFLENAGKDELIPGLSKMKGGPEVKKAIENFLEKHGMRCAGEIDITRDRWSEDPTAIVPMILSNLKNLEPGSSRKKFEKGLKEALDKEAELIHRLSDLPDAEEKIKESKEKIELIRNYSGFREYPKYHIVSRYLVYKQALLKEAEKLVNEKVIQNAEDVFFLTFDEFRELVSTHVVNHDMINKRKAEQLYFEKLTPPRVYTSDGEIITGTYKRDHLPGNALAGIAVSSGIVEGRARVILDLKDASLEEGDILVTTFTDPSWTPLFVSIAGLVTEVGGLMTHGAVIAREYRLPAVVGVEGATQLIKDGQRIRVNGSDGFVEFLD